MPHSFWLSGYCRSLKFRHCNPPRALRRHQRESDRSPSLFGSEQRETELRNSTPLIAVFLQCEVTRLGPEPAVQCHVAICPESGKLLRMRFPQQRPENVSFQLLCLRQSLFSAVQIANIHGRSRDSTRWHAAAGPFWSLGLAPVPAVVHAAHSNHNNASPRP